MPLYNNVDPYYDWPYDPADEMSPDETFFDTSTWFQGAEPLGFLPPLEKDGMPPVKFPFLLGWKALHTAPYGRGIVTWNRCMVIEKGSFHIVLDLYEMGDKISIFNRDLGQTSRYRMKMEEDVAHAYFSMKYANMLKDNF